MTVTSILRLTAAFLSLAILALAIGTGPSEAFVRPSFVSTAFGGGGGGGTHGSRADGGGGGSSSPTQANLFGFLNDGKKALVRSLAGEYDQVAIRARMDGLIADNAVLMLSFTTCPFCIKAKAVLDGVGAKYTVVELDTDPDGKAIRAEMADVVGRTSVPAIWIRSEFVGGCNDGPMGGVVSLNESGKLKGMLQAAGAL